MDVVAKVKDLTTMKGCIDCHHQHHTATHLRVLPRRQVSYIRALGN